MTEFSKSCCERPREVSKWVEGDPVDQDAGGKGNHV